MDYGICDFLGKYRYARSCVDQVCGQPLGHWHHDWKLLSPHFGQSLETDVLPILLHLEGRSLDRSEEIQKIRGGNARIQYQF